MRLAPCLLLTILCTAPAAAQLASRDGTGPPASRAAAPHRTRLILKDGSYQVVLSWKVAGKNVQYVSAERNASVELIPIDLVDLNATRKWEVDHPAFDPDAPPVQRPAPAIDPELLKEEAERALLAPEVAPNLHLAPEIAVLAEDNWESTPELVPMTQTDGELNRQTGHSILPGIIKPQSAPHQMLVLKGERATVQMHVNDPVFYFKLDDALPPGGSGALTVDTHGASSHRDAKTPQQGGDYVILRVDVRQDARVLASFNMAQLGTGKRQEDVFETDIEVLPGGHWMRVKPHESLLVGEYALVELLDEKSINTGVWDFGVHPGSPENRDVLKPEKRRPATLERRDRPD